MLTTRFRRQVVVASVILTLTIGSLLGVMGYQYQKNRLLAQYAVELTNDLPSFLAEIWSSNLLPPFEQWQDSYANSSDKFSMVICDQKNNELWRSISPEAFHSLSKLDGVKLYDLCRSDALSQKIGSIKMIALTSGSHVLLHTIGLSEQDKIPGGRLISIKKMDQSIKPIEQLKWRIIKFALLGTLITLVIVYFLFTVGFKPLNTLQVELSEIKAGKRTRLNDQYPEDLQSITRAFNELMFQQQENEQRYRRALNDLAHSLKTRVAVSQALLDDIEEGKIHDINQQLLEMDDVIQGQLKRASLGVKGIVENATPIKPILNSLLLMFDKVHMDKGIHVEQFINNDQTLPMSKADVMEVFGNVLENAYRYAQKRIDVFINNTEEGIIITFNNDGPAVDESISDTLFKRGVRADEQNPGTGLGLALCDEIVHSYKGAIWFETPSDPSMGASLKVLLPYR